MSIHIHLFIYFFHLGGNQLNGLQQATVQINTNADCNAQYGDGTILKQQLCASAAGKDTCQVKLPFN